MWLPTNTLAAVIGRMPMAVVHRNVQSGTPASPAA
jgi:hypothetical protein